MKPKQWKHCEYCGHEMVIDGTCENCAIIREMQDEFDTWGQRLEQEKIDDEDFNDTRREDWEYDQYRRIDAQDLADAEQAEFPDELDEE